MNSEVDAGIATDHFHHTRGQYPRKKIKCTRSHPIRRAELVWAQSDGSLRCRACVAQEKRVLPEAWNRYAWKIAIEGGLNRKGKADFYAATRVEHAGPCDNHREKQHCLAPLRLGKSETSWMTWKREEMSTIRHERSPSRRITSPSVSVCFC